MFQSPQWGSNSKGEPERYFPGGRLFQSPQWGSNSKAVEAGRNENLYGFSPRNGEVILKCGESISTIF